MDVSKGFCGPRIAARSIRRPQIHQTLLTLLTSHFEREYQPQTLPVSFCTQALNRKGSLISVNPSLRLINDVFLEHLYGLAGHPGLPPRITTNKAERLAVHISSRTSTSGDSLHLVCVGRVQAAGIVTLESLYGGCSITGVASREVLRLQEGLQEHRLLGGLGFSSGRPLSATQLARVG